jgi:hypothetical protein
MEIFVSPAPLLNRILLSASNPSNLRLRWELFAQAPRELAEQNDMKNS